MAQLLLIGLLVVAVLGLAGAGASLLLGDRLVEARLATRVRGLAAPRTALPSLATVGPTIMAALVRWGRRAGRGALDTEDRRVLRHRLVQAGYYQERAAEAFFGIRAAAAIGLTALALLGIALLHLSGLFRIIAILMFAANLGLFLPNLLLSQRIKARAQAIYYGLPDAIDLLVVSLEAGATLSAGLQRVEAEFRDLHPVLTEQFALLLQEMQAGASRADALRRMASRIASDEVKSLANMVVQSEAVGASLGDALRVFAEELRQTRYLEAERKAAELPVKLAFPLVFCIFPCLSGVIFIPIAIRFLRTMSGAAM